MPFDSGSFDFIYCRAAFKNFSEPVRRHQRDASRAEAGRTGIDRRPAKNASISEINVAVEKMGLGAINAVLTKWIFKHSLLKRAYSQ